MGPLPAWLGEQVDVCVIGSGAGGGPMALRLAQAGARVVVLEKGPWYTAADFDHDELRWSRRNAWTPFVSDEPHLLQADFQREPHKVPDGWIAHCVGGGTVHMSGFFYRLHPEDFQMAERFPNLEDAELADWPIGYPDLAPFYDEVERAIGVSGRAGAHPNQPPRSGPYPLPPVLENPLAGLLDEGARALGWHLFPTPRAVLAHPYQGRSACVYCDYCGSYGCEVGAKSSVLAAIIPQAVATGRCEVRPGSMAFEIGLGPDGRASGVRYYDAAGRAQEQRARFVCVSATAVESARLLLNSQSARFPKGLANGSGLVGRHLTFSTLAKGYGVWPIETLPEALRARHPVHFLQRSSQDFYFLPERRGAYDKGGTLNFLLPHRNPIFAAQRLANRSRPILWGEALIREIDRYYKAVRELEFEAFGEFLASSGTYVSVDGQVADRWGIPSATIHLRNHPDDVRNSGLLLTHGLALLEAAGAAETGSESAGGTTFVLQHGTCRFGADPTRSVLDPNCRSHEVDNLYVVDGSFMPTSGGVPTTLTIMANAFRVARHLAGRLKARE